MLRFLTAGESHGPSLTAILEGIPAGLSLTPEIINKELARRQRGYGSGARMKIENDTVKILGGVMGGETTGAPIAMLIENIDHAKWKGKAIEPMTVPRPGHADLTGAVKYGYRDLRPALERASARETAMRVAVGAICKHFLAQFNILIGGYVVSIGGVQAECGNMSYEERFSRAEESDVRCPIPSSAQQMRDEIESAIRGKNTLGGIIEIVALNVPIGIGSFMQWDKRLEARLAMAVMSVQAIKGVEVGEAFENAKRLGTEAHDPIQLTTDRQLLRAANRAGGIEGGISNGQPILVRAAMKPIATTLLPQPTVDLASQTETLTRYERSDFCPVPRAVPILEAMVAFVLADALLEKLGGDSMSEIMPRFATLRKATLDDLPMDNSPHVFWEN
ncbi:MAG TPA: chorismate synthase [Anaerolineales bacterium]|nr:chorismate synthase [Anaerolineales bacterium]